MKSKKKVLSYLAVLSLAASPGALATSLPNLNGLTQVEGVTLFDSPKSEVWFLPTAFQMSFKCMDAGASAPTQLCVLSVFNRLSEAARIAMNQIQAGGKAVLHFRDVDTSVVQSVSETLEGPILNMNGSIPKPPQTLVLNNSTPYFTAYIRVPKGQSGELLRAYAGEGIGTFRSRLRINAERVDTYFALRMPSGAVSHLKGLGNRVLSPGAAVNELVAALRMGVPEASGFTVEEGVQILAKSMSPTLFMAARGGVRIRDSSLVQLQPRNSGPLVLMDDTSDPLTAECAVSLALKAGSTPQVECSEVE